MCDIDMSIKYQKSVSYDKRDFQVPNDNEGDENDDCITSQPLKKESVNEFERLQSFLIGVVDVIRLTKNELSVEIFDNSDFDIMTVRSWFSNYNPDFFRVK